jgi:L-threonylcarbamoyladenylate synthase
MTSRITNESPLASDKITAPDARLRPPFDARARARVATALADGSVMAYPTETFYALGGNALHARLAEEIFRLKGREGGKALLLLVDGARDVHRLAVPSAPAETLMAALWPGALTLVLPAAPSLPAHLRAAGGTVALRWSPHPVIAELLAIGGVPLIGTSANRSGAPPATTADAVSAAFPGAVSVLVDGGATAGGVPSTLLDTTTRPFTILRPGMVSAAAISQALAPRFTPWSPAQP